MNDKQKTFDYLKHGFAADGRSGMAWVHDYQDHWQIEDDQIIVLGPVQFDIMDKTDYNKIYIEDYQPTTEEADNG